MSDLPEGWVINSFNKIFSQIPTTGKKAKTSEVMEKGEYPVIDQGKQFITGYLNNSDLVVSEESPLIVFGDHTREIKWVDFPFIPGADGVKILKLFPKLNSRYFYYFLRSLPIKNKGYARHFKVIREADYFVAPLPEQTRIAEKLDELLAQVDTLKARIDRIPAILKRFRQSVLAAAVSGRLLDGQSDYQNWPVLKARDVCQKVQSGGTPKNGFSDSGIPFLKVYNIVNQRIDFDYKPQYIKEETHTKQSAKSVTVPGDVVMNIVGPPLGKIAVVPDSHQEWNINQAITLFRPSDKITTEWIRVVLEGGDCLRNIMQETKGSAGQVNISLTQCRDFLFPVPPIMEQKEITQRVEQLFAYADQLEAAVNNARARIDRMTQSILAKAFRGELVPQDPNDEPASVLLERIRAERTAQTKPRRNQRKTAD